jgi:hypothetical protein
MTSLAVESFSNSSCHSFLECSKISTFFTEAYADPLCMYAEQMAYFLCSQASGVRFQLSGVVNGPMTHGHEVQSGGRECVTRNLSCGAHCET